MDSQCKTGCRELVCRCQNADGKVVALELERRYRAEAIPLRNSQEWQAQLRVSGGFEEVRDPRERSCIHS